MITKRTKYGVHVMSQSILVQKQRLDHLLVRVAPLLKKQIERRN